VREVLAMMLSVIVSVSVSVVMVMVMMRVRVRVVRRVWIRGWARRRTRRFGRFLLALFRRPLVRLLLLGGGVGHELLERHEVAFFVGVADCLQEHEQFSLGPPGIQDEEGKTPRENINE
jgi:hypothetical protein